MPSQRILSCDYRIVLPNRRDDLFSCYRDQIRKTEDGKPLNTASFLFSLFIDVRFNAAMNQTIPFLSDSIARP